MWHGTAVSGVATVHTDGVRFQVGREVFLCQSLCGKTMRALKRASVDPLRKDLGYSGVDEGSSFLK